MRPDIIQTSLYLPIAMHEALREKAFKERRKMHDIVLKGIELALGESEFPAGERLKAKRKVGNL
jgi:hypothetical protein